jgi:2-amino-4-hydroxy-6-hydroxymethyldihydropteridine diphosphokinase
MQYERWAPLYEQIAREFGFAWEREERAADRLESLLPAPARDRPLERVRPRLSGRDVIVVGAAPDAGPPPLWRLPGGPLRPVLVASDSATSACLDAGFVPSVITSDLDGPIPPEISANRRGALVVVHAHGDNIAALEEWVPQFPGELAGSWAGPPRPGLLDVGGFTDGDRAAYLADAVGARSLLLWGFEFDRADEPTTEARDRKLAKLRWAARSLDELARHGGTPIRRWERDGSISAYPPGSTVESTR